MNKKRKYDEQLRPGVRGPPSRAKNNCSTIHRPTVAAGLPVPAAVGSSTSSNLGPSNVLVSKFDALERALADVLSCPATEDEWKLALGSAGKADFVSTVRALQAGGDLAWLSPAPPDPITAVTQPAPPLTASTRIPSSWPPPLPPINSPALRSQVFTHTTYADANHLTSPSAHYQRLEFLGDAALKYFLTKHLYHRFPQYRENLLSTLRSSIESNKNLYSYCHIYGLDRRVKLGKDGITSGADKQVKFGADVFEAYIGALVIDDETSGGWASLEKWLSELVEPRVKMGAEEVGDKFEVDRDAKQNLNLAVSNCKGVTVEFAWEGGGGGNQGGYWFAAYLTGYGYQKLELGRGWGHNKNDAQLRTAMNALRNETLIDELKRKKDEYLTSLGIKKPLSTTVAHPGDGDGGPSTSPSSPPSVPENKVCSRCQQVLEATTAFTHTYAHTG